MLRRIRQAVARRIYEMVKATEANEQLRRRQVVLANAKQIGSGFRLNGEFRITGADQMTVGDNVHIGDNVFIRAEGGLTIGDNTHISRNLVLYTINHHTKGMRIPYDEQLVHRSVHVGRNVWIGMNVCIVPGTVIGDGAIIGMGTVVSGNVPAHSIVVSSKWRIVGYRNSEHYEACDAARQYGGIDGLPIS